MAKNIEIELSKNKMILALSGCIGFILISFWFIYYPEKFVNSIVRSKELIFSVGIIGILTFGLFGIMILPKLSDSKKGLIITDEGIIDNSSATAIGKIDWNDIIDIRTENVMSTKFLMIMTDKPEKYINLAKNKIAKKAMIANHKLYGSPIAITSNALKINFSELEILIKREFENQKYQKNVV